VVPLVEVTRPARIKKVWNFFGFRFEIMEREMNRNELAQEFNVRPWDVDDWLLWGCPAKKIRREWEFNVEKVKTWLETEKIKIKPRRPQNLPSKPIFDCRWFTSRCPVCTDRGFLGEKAGRVYTLGEVSEGGWNLRRTGIPCGHSAYLNSVEILSASQLKDR
jgi:hypothetical protein